MSFSSITQRFVVWFLVIALLPLLLVGYSLLSNFETELQETVVQQISVIADKKVDQIDGYLNERVLDALLKVQGNTTRRAMGDFIQVVARDGVKSEAYRRLDAGYRDYFKRFITGAGYYDLFLISPQGTVVYSHTHEAYLATNLLAGPYRILLDETGLGHSSETVVARREDEHTALVMAPLKSDPDAAMKRKIPLGNPDRGAPMIRALNGERGSGFEIDCNGQPVAAAWRYLPRMGWGMVVKVDRAEALAPLYRVRTFAMVVIGLALGAIFLGALLFGRRVVIPLKELSKSAQDIATGKLDQRVPVVGRDELGQLAATFNTMAERLQSSYANLEGQVARRTSELTQSLVNLRIKDAAIASSIDAIAIADLDGKITYVNQAFVELWRRQRSEGALGRSLAELWAEPEEAQVVMKMLQQQEHWQGELRAGLLDGTLADLQLSAHLVVDEADKPVCMMVSFQDVTASKIAEQKLQKSEALLDSIITDMPAMVFVKRASDLRFERLNRAGEELLGFSEQELLGKNDYDLFPREQADFFSASDREIMASHQVKEIPAYAQGWYLQFRRGADAFAGCFYRHYRTNSG